MPRANWKGVISFGLVSIPVTLVNSQNTTEKISFHQIDKRNNARIKYQRINTETGEEVPWNDIIMGYEYSKDIILPVEEGEIKKIVGENARTVAIESFVNKDSIDFIDIEKTYYLLPDKNGVKGYVILREALKETHKIAIAKVIISTKEYVAAVACYKDALVLYLLRYHQEIKPLSEFDIPSTDLKKYHVSPAEVKMAKQFVTSMTTKWQPEKYKDEYQESVREWADIKIKHKRIKKKLKKVTAKNQKILNFIDLLKQSLKENKQNQKMKKVMKQNVRAKKSASTKRATLH